MMMCFTLYNKAPFCQLQWRFYIRGRWGTAPPDPDDAVVQKAQYIRTSRQYIYIYFFFMQSSVNICVNKLDSQALLFWSNLICVFFCLFACSVKCCSPLSLPFRWGNGPRCPTVTMEPPMSVNHTGQS